MRHRWFSGAGILLSLVLMALPCGVSMAFGIDAENRLIRQFSYFSLTPAGYGNWFPLLSVLFTLLALLFLLLRRDYKQMSPVCLALAVASQALSWLLFGSLTLVSAVSVVLQLSILSQGIRTSWMLRTERSGTERDARP